MPIAGMISRFGRRRRHSPAAITVYFSCPARQSQLLNILRCTTRLLLRFTRRVLIIAAIYLCRHPLQYYNNAADVFRFD